MVLKATLVHLSDNDADYFARTLGERGADVYIDFMDGEAAVKITQNGSLECILQTASIVFHHDEYDIHISEGGYEYGKEEKH